MFSFAYMMPTPLVRVSDVLAEVCVSIYAFLVSCWVYPGFRVKCFGDVILFVLCSSSGRWGYFDERGASHAFERWSDSNDEDCFEAHITAYDRNVAASPSPSSFVAADGLGEVPEGGSDRGRGRWSWLGCSRRASP